MLLSCVKRDDHFCRPPHVAMRFGLSHHYSNLALVEGAWRTVSEDPVSGFLLINRTDRIVTAEVLTSALA